MSLRGLANRYGHRGLWLILMGCMWAVFGVGILLRDRPTEAWVLHESIPAPIRAALWITTGAAAVWVGTRGPRSDDALGHVALYLMPAFRLLSYTLSWVLFVVSSALHALLPSVDVVGYSAGWYAALIWSFVSGMLGLAARWPNPVVRMPLPPAATREAG